MARVGKRFTQYSRGFLRKYIDFRKISSKLLFSIIFVGVALPLTISIFLINFTETRINEYVVNRNKNSITLAKKSIEQFINTQISLINSYAYNRSVVEADPYEMRHFFIRVERDFQIFRSFRLYDINEGDAPLFTTKQEYVSEPLGLKANAIETLKNQEPYISSVSISEQIEPTLQVYFPVVRFGETNSVLVCEVHLAYIWTLVDNITFGRYGKALLITGDNRIIAHPDKSLIVGDTRTNFTIDKSELSGQISYEDVNGNAMVGFYEKIDNLDWYLLVEQELDEARDLAIEMRFNMLLYLTVSLVIAILVGVVFSRRISRPIEELTTGVKNFGQGFLQQQILVETNDELQDLAEEFNRMSKTLYYNQKKLRRIERISAMTKFVRLVSHEIRNPLNSMNINMQILKREAKKDSPDTGKLTKFLDVISSEITRMDDLISNYTMIAQTPQLDIQKHDIGDILRSVILIQQAEAKQKGITIKEFFSSDTIMAQVDLNQIKQVIINLLLNAIQAMDKKGEIRMFLLKKNERTCTIRIEDEGKGIPPDKLSEIFEFYYTSKQSGTGIGLSLSKQIVEGHNGQIYVESKVSVGTSFFIELPTT